jgi:hypothetical protein
MTRAHRRWPPGGWPTVGVLLAGMTASGTSCSHGSHSGPSSPKAAFVPRPDHVVVVMEENHSYGEVIGSSAAPYINSLAQAGALFTDSHAIEHPSQPNYLDLFSGSNQGVTDDSCPHTFSMSNLGEGLIRGGLTFGGYSEDLPSTGYTGCASGFYARRHNPWVNFTNIPAAANKPFASWPSDLSNLPTLSFVVPNVSNDMHDLTSGTVERADTWLHDHLEAYRQWAMSHNSLLIVTWDEDDNTASNHIATIFVGPMVRPGRYAERINHFNVLRTIEDMYGLPAVGGSATAGPVTDVWTTQAEGADFSRIGVPDAVDIANTTSSEIHFHRGDANADGKLDLTDAFFLLDSLIRGDKRPTCMESADSDNDGAVTISDAILLLNFLLAGGRPPAAPGPTRSPCGLDPDEPGSPGDLGCAEYNACGV